MPDRVLVPYDGSTQATRALDEASALFPDATIVVLHVIDPGEATYSGGEAGPYFPDGWYDTAVDTAERHLETAREHLSDRSVETHHEVGRPAQTIVEFVDDEDVDYVVVGSHGRTGVARLLLGSVAEGVVRRSAVPVMVVR